MKKLYTLLMMAMMGVMAVSLTSCDDEQIAYTLEGTWRGLPEGSLRILQRNGLLGGLLQRSALGLRGQSYRMGGVQPQYPHLFRRGRQLVRHPRLSPEQQPLHGLHQRSRHRRGV